MNKQKMNPELLYRYLENTATDAQMKEVLDWLDADTAHQRELDELDKVFAASVIHGKELLLQGAVKKTSRTLPFRRIGRYAVQVAAVVAIGLGLTWVLMENRLGEWSRRMTTLEVPAGYHLSLKLQDGTTVWLNSGAKLEYPLVFARGERRVKISGEAMFDVTHDADHPFVVETFACDVEVLGTKFDVVAEEQERLFSTALLRGSVRVTNRLMPQEQFVLKPNEQVRLVGSHLSLHMISNPDDYLWTEGLLSVKGLSFRELMRKFEKNFGVKIIVTSNRIPDIDYNHGKIRVSDGVESALRLLQLTADFSYTRNTEDGTIIIR